MKKSLLTGLLLATSGQAKELTLKSEVTPFLNKYCIECHGGKKVKGKLDLTKIKNQKDLLKNYEVFESALDLIHEKEMPPDDELQPSKKEVALYENWYKKTFIQNVKAQAGPAKPRRLSVNEYKNTLRDLLGFDLNINFAEAEETVMEKSLVKKIMPLDPPGKSGFQNDTHDTPLTSVLWGKYAFISETAVSNLFQKKNRSHLEKYSGTITKNNFTKSHAEKLIKNFAPMAFRRHMPTSEIQKTLSRIDSEDVIESTKFELKAMLMSPRFLFRGHMVKTQSGKQQKVDDYEIAERLSYFIWGSMPDKKLLSLAYRKKLNSPEILKKEINRMASDDKSKNLAEDFAYQWFALNEIEHIGGRFPVTKSMMTQPVYFFNYLIKENRPLMELIDSKVSFANPLLRSYYDKKDQKGIKAYRKGKGIEIEYVPHSRITLENTTTRGGILTMPGILAMNASKGRTSPVLRGTWVLERILGDHLPEPPNDVGVVAENKKGQNLSFRERFEIHKSNKTCAVCHDRIDPLGFALESYDSMGKFRSHMGGIKNRKTKVTSPKSPIDASGELYGEKFTDFTGLKKLLKTKHKETIIRNIVRKTMSYALCRKLEVYDKEAVEKIVSKMIKENGTYQDLIFTISQSMPFQEVYLAKEN
ncbi:MAG: DUF1588 domain-containing protein [Lentisphaeraceae bacterium]|nr:DUF1588 domain-containing protein [Lentisphaeraceae bacterium]